MADKKANPTEESAVLSLSADLKDVQVSADEAGESKPVDQAAIGADAPAVEATAESAGSDAAVDSASESLTVDDQAADASVAPGAASVTDGPPTEAEPSATEEALAPSVDVAAESAEQSQQGESFLLPLLQGLLHKNNAVANTTAVATTATINTTTQDLQHPHKPPQATATTTKQPKAKPPPPPTQKASTGGSKPHDTRHIDDSGTESGEDLKLLAAGLHDQLNQTKQIPQAAGAAAAAVADADLLADVTAALSRLQYSLSNAEDAALDPVKRSALLTLAARLQTGLHEPERITAPTPLPPGARSVIRETNSAEDRIEADNDESDAANEANAGRQRSVGRFAKRKGQRQNRHTVGVSQEELADARRYIEELVLLENRTSNQTSLNSLPKDSSSEDVPAVKQPSASLSNIARQTSDGDAGVTLRDKRPDAPQQRPYSEAIGTQLADQMHREMIATNLATKASHMRTNVMDKVNVFAQKASEAVVDSDAAERPPPNSVAFVKRRSFEESDKPDVNSSAASASGSNNRYAARKLKMKRANTIDIPKQFQNGADSSDNENANRTQVGSFRRGLLVSSTNSAATPRSNLPPFEAKTDNDRKFLAFIQKQSSRPPLHWVNPTKSESLPSTPSSVNGGPTNNWRNTFGSVRKTFESAASSSSSSPICAHKPPPSAARNFWKHSETVKKTDSVIAPAPNGHQLPTTNRVFSAPKQSVDLPQKSNVSTSAGVRGATVNEVKPYNFVQTQLQKSEQILSEQSTTIALQAPTVQPSKPSTAPSEKNNARNSFSHAPASAFRPIGHNSTAAAPPSTLIIPPFKPIKPEPETVQSPAHGNDHLPVQPLAPVAKPAPLSTHNLIHAFQSNTQRIGEATSPVASVGTPWANRSAGQKPDQKRVLNIAATRFDVKTLPSTAIGQRSKSMRYTTAQPFQAPSSAPDDQQRRGSLPNAESYLRNAAAASSAHQTVGGARVPQPFRPLSHDGQMSTGYNAAPLYSSHPSLPSYNQQQRPLQYPLPPPPLINYAVPPMAYQHVQPSHPLQPINPTTYPHYQSQPPVSHPLPRSNLNTSAHPNIFSPTDTLPPQYQAAFTSTDYTAPCSVSTFAPTDRNATAVPIVLYNTSAYASLPPSTINSSLTTPATTPFTGNSRSHTPASIASASVSPNPHSAAAQQAHARRHRTSQSIDDEAPLTAGYDDASSSDVDSLAHEGQEFVAKSHVMRGPVSHSAITVSSRTQHRSSESSSERSVGEREAARELQSALKAVASHSSQQRQHQVATVRPTANVEPTQSTPTAAPKFVTPTIVQTPSTPVIVSHQPAAPAFPAAHATSNGHAMYFNNVHQQQQQFHQQQFQQQQFQAQQQQHYGQPQAAPVNLHHHAAQAHHSAGFGLSKSDSWQRICQASQQQHSNVSHAPVIPDDVRCAIQKTKSSHQLLALPKPFEASLNVRQNSAEVSEKQRRVAAYFAVEKSPQSLSRSASGQQINHQHHQQQHQLIATDTATKSTTSKAQITRIRSSSKSSSSLSRSQTMPLIGGLHLLDESNVEDAFEDLFNESMS